MLVKTMDSVSHRGHAAYAHSTFGFGSLSYSASVHAALRASRAARAAATGAVSAALGTLPPAAIIEVATPGRDAA